MKVAHNALRPFDRTAYYIAALDRDEDGTIDVLLMKSGDTRTTLTWRTNPNESWREQSIWKELHYCLTGTDWPTGALAADNANFATWLKGRTHGYGATYVWPMVETFHEGPQVVGFWLSGESARALAPIGISYAEWRRRGPLPRHQPGAVKHWRAQEEVARRTAEDAVAARAPEPVVTESYDPYVGHRVKLEAEGRELPQSRLALPHDLIRKALTVFAEIQHEDYV